MRCVAGFEVADAAAATGDMEAPMKSRARTLTKTYSNLSEYSVSPSELPLAEVKENKQSMFTYAFSCNSLINDLGIH